MTYSEKLNILVKNTIEYYSNCEEVITHKKYYDNIEKYNKNYKGRINEFFTDNNIDKEKFMYGLTAIHNITMLEKLKDNTKNILQSIAKYWIPEDYLNKRLENNFGGVNILGTDILNDIRYWLFDGDYNNNMLSLEQQNIKAINYVHFNAGMKKIKSVE